MCLLVVYYYCQAKSINVHDDSTNADTTEVVAENAQTVKQSEPEPPPEPKARAKRVSKHKAIERTVSVGYVEAELESELDPN